jgi:hypothetical protein
MTYPQVFESLRQSRDYFQVWSENGAIIYTTLGQKNGVIGLGIWSPHFELEHVVVA